MIRCFDQSQIKQEPEYIYGINYQLKIKCKLIVIIISYNWVQILKVYQGHISQKTHIYFFLLFYSDSSTKYYSKIIRYW